MSLFPSSGLTSRPRELSCTFCNLWQKGRDSWGTHRGLLGQACLEGVLYLISTPIPSAGKWEHVYCPMEESNPSRAAGLGRGHLFSGTVSGRQALLPSPPSCSWDLSPLQPPDSRCITAPSLCFQTPLHTPQMSRSVGLKMTVCFKTLQKVKENRTEMHADEKQERRELLEHFSLHSRMERCRREEQKGRMSKTEEPCASLEEQRWTQLTGGRALCWLLPLSLVPSSSLIPSGRCFRIAPSGPETIFPGPFFRAWRIRIEHRSLRPCCAQEQDLGQSSEGQVLRLFLCEAPRKEVPGKKDCL